MEIWVWSITQENKTRFGIGRKPRGAGIVGTFEKLYDPMTGMDSEHYSYQPRPFMPQPDAKWLYNKALNLR